MTHHDPRNAFHWNTGAPSIFWSEATERAARFHSKAKGKVMDIQGRAVVGIAPKSEQAISISKTPKADSARNQSIQRGGI